MPFVLFPNRSLNSCPFKVFLWDEGRELPDHINPLRVAEYRTRIIREHPPSRLHPFLRLHRLLSIIMAPKKKEEPKPAPAPKAPEPEPPKEPVFNPAEVQVMFSNLVLLWDSNPESAPD